MQRRFYIFLFVMLANFCYGSGNKVAAPLQIKIDTTTVSVRHFDTLALNAYAKQPEFHYNETTENPTWWTRFWRWFWNVIKKLFSSDSPKKNFKVDSIWLTVLKYTFIGLGIAALAFLIFKLIGIDMRNIFRRKVTTVPIPYSEFFEDINAISFDTEIENAVSKRNYRLAVRLLYLRSLKQLSDAGLIEWGMDKTNSDYIKELQDEGQRSAFKTLTRQFEYVWYGEFMIDGTLYNLINLSFQDFNRRGA